MPESNSAEQLSRSVFQTFLQVASGPWEFHSAVEIGLQLSQNVVSSHVVLFRDKQGNTHDISTLVQVSTQTSGQVTCSIRLSDKQSTVPDLLTGFEIVVHLSNNILKGFEGKLGSNLWKGQYVCPSSLALSTILEGEKPIPDVVQRFLNITPLVTQSIDGKPNTVDQARLWAKELFKDMTLHSLSDKAKSLYFENLGGIGDAFASQNLPSKNLPSQLKDQSFPFALASILLEDNKVLSVCAMHLLCRALKKATWLESKYRDGIKDDCDAFFANLQGKTVDQDTIPGFILAGMNIQNIADALRSQYMDAISRCYFAAYVCVCPALVDFLQNPVSIYEQVKTVLLSDNYKAHWIPKTIEAGSDVSGQALKTRLGTLHDKLILLLSAAKKFGGNWQGQTPDVDRIIDQLVRAARETGLVDLSNVHLDPESITFTPGSIYSDDQMNQMWRLSMQEIALNSGGAPIYSPPIDIRQYETNTFLTNEATPLGLYNEPPFISSASDCLHM